MITLLTGLPGNGKTLFGLWYIKSKAEKEQREVFYHNIKDLNLPWTACDPEKWFDLPKGSIIVIDEAQFVFPKKPNGSKLPDFYEKLAVHRHSGYDIYVITQHPSLIDNFVRQLVGQHFHAVRKFGLNRATIYEWSACTPAPQNPSAQKSAVTLKWPYPKEVFGYYKSAEVHTVKRSVPMKLILALLFVVAVPVVGYYALDKFQSRGKNEVVPPAAAITQGVPVVSVAPSVAGEKTPGHAPVDPVADAQEYMFNQTPRVAGLAHTAPKYDPITVPVRAPVPAACIQIGSTKSSTNVRCQCYSQTGTKLDVQFDMCIQIAQNGWFKDFNEDSVAKGQQSPETAHIEPQGRSVTVNEVRPAVVAFNDAVASVTPPPAPSEENSRPGRAIRNAGRLGE